MHRASNVTIDRLVRAAFAENPHITSTKVEGHHAPVLRTSTH